MESKFCSGDVILFEMEEKNEDFLGKCIAELTGSNITHSAMLYKDNAMVEMTDSGIAVTPFHFGENGYKVHMLRLVPEKDSKPLQKAAEVYLKKHINYDFASLFLLAGLIIFKNTRFTKEISKVVFEILQVVCQQLDELYQELTNQGDAKSMMCSQLVYQCYYDCGLDYRIKIQNGLLQKSAGNLNSIALYEYATREYQPTNVKWEYTQNNIQLSNVRIESLAKELFHALTQEKSIVLEERSLDKEFSFITEKTREFINKAESLLKIMKIDLPLPALFVTPADLFKHAENLKHYCTTSIIIEG